MTKTRGRGQIIDRGSGSWLIKIYRGRNGNGKRIYSNNTIRGKRSDAQKFLTAKMREKDLGIFIEVNKQTLNEHLDNWLKLIRARVAEQTFNSYEAILRVHIRGSTGQLRLSNIKTHDIQGIYTSMLERGLSPRTVRYAHAVIAMAMKKAVELNYIIRNPCEFVELPREIRKETKAMSPDQAMEFLRHAQDDRHGLIFEFAIISGMRPEEYLALKWSDIDFVNRTVKVQRALVWLKGGYKMSEPKTKKSRRNIPLPNDLMVKLKEHKKRQLERRFKLGDSYENLNLVFSTEAETPIHYRNLTQRHYEKIIKKAELEDEGFVLYSLRHTCATLLLASGENPKVVADRLGHTSVKMTLDTYSHVLPDMQRSASDRLGAMLYRAT
jgi:integrase